MGNTKESLLKAEKVFFEYMEIEKYPAHRVILDSQDVVQMIALGIERALADSSHEISGLNKPVVSVSLLSIENTDKYAKKWADNFGEIGDTNYSIALTSYRRGLKKAVKIISNAR